MTSEMVYPLPGLTGRGCIASSDADMRSLTAGTGDLS